jgi:4-hydroxythreonine-4-phosphate dehydrogenase
VATDTIRIAVTPGEPAGIGADITVQMAQHPYPFEIVAVADTRVLQDRARSLGLPLNIEQFNGDETPSPHQGCTLKVLDLPCVNRPNCGVLDPANVPYVLDSLRTAVAGCLNGGFAALVTGPVHKANINNAGIAFTGHTEFLAELTNTSHVVMMLATTGLRVALVTTHIPLRDVSDCITRELVETTLKITRQQLQQYFAIDNPNMVVCGLNPHAGEGGHLGNEETEIIIPVIEKLRSQGLTIQGPLPADTAFIPKYMDTADVFVAMYHDQGLPVLKYKGFGNAINITLGLPIIRTSVDHGTALELAGTGNTDATSLISAIHTATAMHKNQQLFLQKTEATGRA